MSTNAPEYVVNELLMYVCSKLDSDTADDVTKTVDDFYGDEAVNDAKVILWEHYGVLAVLGRNISRRTKCKQVEDIVDALRTVDSTYPDKLQMPTIFVARCMFNLPTITQSPSTVPTNHNCALENRVQILESQMVEFIKTAMPPTGSSSRNDHMGVINKVPTDNGQDTTPGDGDGHRLSYSEALNDGQPRQTSTQQQQQGGRHDGQDNGPAGQQRVFQPKTTGGDEGWKTAHSRRGRAVYGNKQSDVLKAPPRRYELVVFNVTRDHDADSVKSYITSDGVDVLSIKPLPTNNDLSNSLMFKVDVHYKDKETVLDSGFWPENVGCREFYKRARFEKRADDKLNHDG